MRPPEPEEHGGRAIGCIIWLLAMMAGLWCLIVWSRSDQIPPEPQEQRVESIEEPEGWGERSSAWPSVRREHVQRHPYCEACSTIENLNVHHIEPFHEAPELELEPSNLITLCRVHHFYIGHDPDGPWMPKKPSWRESNPLVREHCRRFKEQR